MPQNRPSAEKPWYKNHILWLIIIIPLSSVAGSFYTLYRALSSERSSVIDSYYKQGVSPNMQHYQDKALNIRIEKNILYVENLTQPAALVLTLEHPTLGREDRQYTLQAAQPGFYPLPGDALDKLYTQKWYFKIEPQDSDEHWQQRGHYNPKTMNPGATITFSAR